MQRVILRSRASIARVIRLIVLGGVVLWSASHTMEQVTEGRGAVRASENRYYRDLEGRFGHDFPPPAHTDASARAALDALLDQSTQSQNIAVLILGGIATILVTTRVHRGSRPEWAYIPFGAAAVFLLGSCISAFDLKNHYVLCLTQTGGCRAEILFWYVRTQSHLLTYSVASLVCFALWFLTLVVIGSVRPDADESAS